MVLLTLEVEDPVAMSDLSVADNDREGKHENHAWLFAKTSKFQPSMGMKELALRRLSTLCLGLPLSLSLRMGSRSNFVWMWLITRLCGEDKKSVLKPHFRCRHSGKVPNQGADRFCEYLRTCMNYRERRQPCIVSKRWQDAQARHRKEEND